MTPEEKALAIEKCTKAKEEAKAILDQAKATYDADPSRENGIKLAHARSHFNSATKRLMVWTRNQYIRKSEI